MPEQRLATWIKNELAKRDWNQSDLARRAGLTRARVSQILDESKPRMVRIPGDATINGLARALSVSSTQIRTIIGEEMGIPTRPVPVGDPALISDDELLSELGRRLAARSRPVTARRSAMSVVEGTLGAVADDRPDDMAAEIEGQQDEP